MITNDSKMTKRKHGCSAGDLAKIRARGSNGRRPFLQNNSTDMAFRHDQNMKCSNNIKECQMENHMDGLKRTQLSVSQHLDVLLVVPAQQRFLHPLHPVLERLQLGFQCGDGLLGSEGRSRRQLGFFLQQGHPDNTRAAWHTEDPKVVLLRLRISPWVPVRLPGTCGGTLPAAASPAHALFGALWGEHELSVTGTRTPAVASPRPTAPHELEGLRGALLCPGISPCRASSCSLLRASNFSFSSRSFPSSTWRCQTLNVP